MSYTWPQGYTSAFSFTIDVDAESPQLWRAREHGIQGLNELEQRRFGLRQGIFNLLELLEKHGCKATCFVPVYESTTRPWLLERIAQGGHEIGLHGFYHEVPAQLGAARFHDITAQCLDFFTKNLGYTPVGYRSPSWELTPSNLTSLKELGLRYDSSLSGYDHPYQLNGITEIPIQWPLDDAVFIRYAGVGNDRWAPHFTHTVTQGWLDYARGVAQYGGVAVCTVHPWLTGRPGRIALAEKMLEYALQDSTIWVASTGEIADYHQSSMNYNTFNHDAEAPSLPPNYCS